MLASLAILGAGSGVKACGCGCRGQEFSFLLHLPGEATSEITCKVCVADGSHGSTICAALKMLHHPGMSPEGGVVKALLITWPAFYPIALPVQQK